MSFAIVGGTGFIGNAVAKRLTQRGMNPVVIARGQHPIALPDGAIFEAADRTDADALLTIFRRHNVDTIIDIFALSLGNTAPVLKAAGAIGGRYLLLSSIDVYSNYGGLLRRENPPIRVAPAKEDDELRVFRFPYRNNGRRPKGVDDALFDDYDKILLEEAALGDTRFATTVMRAPMIFGPGDKQHRFAWAIEAVKHGGTITIDERAAHWPNSYGFITDVAEAICLAALSPQAQGRTYNVGQPFVRTPIEWLMRFAALMDQAIIVQTVPREAKGLLWERAEASDLRYPLTLDSSRIRSELGYVEPTGEEEALRATIAAGG